MSSYLNETDESNELNYKESNSERADLNETPIVSFGIITDIQYADVDDGWNYEKTKERRYRNALNLLKEAVQDWNSKKEATNLKFIVQLGDVIDAKADKNNHRDEALKLVLDEFGKTDLPLYSCWGNHEMYNYLRKDLVNTPLNNARTLNPTVADNANYYVLHVTDKFKMIFLDFYEFASIGFEEDDEIYKKAIDLLKKHNTNEDLNSAENLRGHAKRFTAFNGSVSFAQLAWLEDTLKGFKSSDVKAIICSHLPVHPSATTSSMCLAWNHKEVLDLIGQYEKTVLAFVSGHDHDGGFFRDKSNIQHITLPAVLETPPNTNAYAIVKVFSNRILVQGVGVIENFEIYY